MAPANGDPNKSNQIVAELMIPPAIIVNVYSFQFTFYMIYYQFH